MALPRLPLMEDTITTDDKSLILQTKRNVERVYDYLQSLIDDFPNAVGNAIDPSLGESGDGSLTITEAPSNITYTLGSGLSVDGVLFGHIDISFTLPDRAADLAICYREQGVENFKVSYAPKEHNPYRLVSLKVGVTYELQLTGRAANNTLGPHSTLTEVTIPTSLLDTSIPTSLQAVGTYQSIVLTWVESTGLPQGYQVERAEDAGFTANLTTWRVDANKFVDDINLDNTTRYYRVKSFNKQGGASGYSNTASATTDSIIFDHLHGITRLTGDGVKTTFDLFDVAEYVEITTKQGLEVDTLLYSLSSDRTQIIFNVAPLLADIIHVHYVIARV